MNYLDFVYVIILIKQEQQFDYVKTISHALLWNCFYNIPITGVKIYSYGGVLLLYMSVYTYNWYSTFEIYKTN